MITACSVARFAHDRGSTESGTSWSALAPCRRRRWATCSAARVAAAITLSPSRPSHSKPWASTRTLQELSPLGGCYIITDDVDDWHARFSRFRVRALSSHPEPGARGNERCRANGHDDSDVAVGDAEGLAVATLRDR